MAGFDPHVDIPEQLQNLLVKMSACRNDDCLVPKRHPTYFDIGGPSGACAPVVPTRIQTGGVMILGAYPNTRYRTWKGDKFVPAVDIDEPFEDSRYFDGSGIRDHLSGALLEEAYLRPLGLSRNDVYVTNVVKCFLFRTYDVESYGRHGFPGAGKVEATRRNYLRVAMLCHSLWLAAELEIARPKLVIALGGEVRQVIHANDGEPGSASGISDIGGVLLPAARRGHESDTRDENGPFFGLNVVHLYHPGALLRDDEGGIIKRHEEKHLPSVNKILRELGHSPVKPKSKAGLRSRLDALRDHMANDPGAPG